MEYVNEKLEEFNTYLENRKVAIIGLGVSNLPLIDYLYEKRAKVTVFDEKEIDQIPKEVMDKITKEIKNVDITKIMAELGLEVKLKNKETVVYINGKEVEAKDLQSAKSSLAVSAISNVADNTKLYEFGKQLIDSFREKYNVILSSRDIVKMYPDVAYHFFITADLEERINRKYIQYKGEISKEQIKATIEKRDKLQEDSGYYKIYKNTKVIDVTDCKTIEKASKKVLENIKFKVTI